MSGLDAEIRATRGHPVNLEESSSDLIRGSCNNLDRSNFTILARILSRQAAGSRTILNFILLTAWYVHAVHLAHVTDLNYDSRDQILKNLQ